jgi:hypothetical protein
MSSAIFKSGAHTGKGTADPAKNSPARCQYTKAFSGDEQ